MNGHLYTVEELMLDNSFISWCLADNPASHWNTVISDNPGQKAVFDEAKGLVMQLHGGISRDEVNRQIEEVRRLLHEQKKIVRDEWPVYEPALSFDLFISDDGRINRKRVRKVLSYIGIACLLGIASVWFVLRFQNPTPVSATVFTPVETKKSLFGERREFLLPDGSMAILNSNSSISWDNSFNKEKREIHLIGNAFFKVAKNANKPFVVITGNITSTALGTEFYIHGKRDGEQNIEIDLLEGKLKVMEAEETAGSPLILLPGEKARSEEKMSLKKETFDIAQLRNWLKGSISFNKTPPQKAIKQLEDWYGIEIKVKKKDLGNQLLVGDYKNETLQNILQVICFTIDCRCSFSGNTVIIE